MKEATIAGHTVPGLFTIVKDNEFLGTIDTSRHYSDFVIAKIPEHTFAFATPEIAERFLELVHDALPGLQELAKGEPVETDHD